MMPNILFCKVDMGNTGYKEKNWKGKTNEHFEKFLDPWKNTNPRFPEVEDAKRLLAGL